MNVEWMRTHARDVDETDEPFAQLPMADGRVLVVGWVGIERGRHRWVGCVRPDGGTLDPDGRRDVIECEVSMLAEVDDITACALLRDALEQDR
jgi:hypothetical protein